jgi:hypothetical protein
MILAELGCSILPKWRPETGFYARGRDLACLQPACEPTLKELTHEVLRELALGEELIITQRRQKGVI